MTSKDDVVFPSDTIAPMPWRLLLSLAVLASVILMIASKRRPLSPANRRLFFAIRLVLVVAIVALFYLTFFARAA